MSTREIKSIIEPQLTSSFIDSDSFGHSFDTQGNLFVISAPGRDNDKGQVYTLNVTNVSGQIFIDSSSLNIFDPSDSTFSSVIFPDPSFFGREVATNGKDIFISTGKDDNASATRVVISVNVQDNMQLDNPVLIDPVFQSSSLQVENLTTKHVNIDGTLSVANDIYFNRIGNIVSLNDTLDNNIFRTFDNTTTIDDDGSLVLQTIGGIYLFSTDTVLKSRTSKFILGTTENELSSDLENIHKDPNHIFEVVEGTSKFAEDIFVSGIQPIGTNVQIGTQDNPFDSTYIDRIHGTLQTPSQPNISSVGNLDNLQVNGNILTQNLSVSGELYLSSVIRNENGERYYPDEWSVLGDLDKKHHFILENERLVSKNQDGVQQYSLYPFGQVEHRFVFELSSIPNTPRIEIGEWFEITHVGTSSLQLVYRNPISLNDDISSIDVEYIQDSVFYRVNEFHNHDLLLLENGEQVYPFWIHHRRMGTGYPIEYKTDKIEIGSILTISDTVSIQDIQSQNDFLFTITPKEDIFVFNQPQVTVKRNGHVSIQSQNFTPAENGLFEVKATEDNVISRNVLMDTLGRVAIHNKEDTLVAPFQVGEESLFLRPSHFNQIRVGNIQIQTEEERISIYEPINGDYLFNNHTFTETTLIDNINTNGFRYTRDNTIKYGTFVVDDGHLRLFQLVSQNTGIQSTEVISDTLPFNISSFLTQNGHAHDAPISIDCYEFETSGIYRVIVSLHVLPASKSYLFTIDLNVVDTFIQLPLDNSAQTVLMDVGKQVSMSIDVLRFGQADQLDYYFTPNSIVSSTLDINPDSNSGFIYTAINSYVSGSVPIRHNITLQTLILNVARLSPLGLLSGAGYTTGQGASDYAFGHQSFLSNQPFPTWIATAPVSSSEATPFIMYGLDGTGRRLFIPQDDKIQITQDYKFFVPPDGENDRWGQMVSVSPDQSIMNVYTETKLYSYAIHPDLFSGTLQNEVVVSSYMILGKQYPQIFEFPNPRQYVRSIVLDHYAIQLRYSVTNPVSLLEMIDLNTMTLIRQIETSGDTLNATHLNNGEYAIFVQDNETVYFYQYYLHRQKSFSNDSVFTIDHLGQINRTQTLNSTQNDLMFSKITSYTDDHNISRELNHYQNGSLYLRGIGSTGNIDNLGLIRIEGNVYQYDLFDSGHLHIQNKTDSTEDILSVQSKENSLRISASGRMIIGQQSSDEPNYIIDIQHQSSVIPYAIGIVSSNQTLELRENEIFHDSQQEVFSIKSQYGLSLISSQSQLNYIDGQLNMDTTQEYLGQLNIESTSSVMINMSNGVMYSIGIEEQGTIVHKQTTSSRLALMFQTGNDNSGMSIFNDTDKACVSLGIHESSLLDISDGIGLSRLNFQNNASNTNKNNGIRFLSKNGHNCWSIYYNEGIGLPNNPADTNNLYFEFSGLVNGVENSTTTLAMTGDTAGFSLLNFTGQHRYLPTKNFHQTLSFLEEDDYTGLLVQSTGTIQNMQWDQTIKPKQSDYEIDEALSVIEPTQSYKSKTVVGVICGMEQGDTRRYQSGMFIMEKKIYEGDRRYIVNSLGEGALWVIYEPHNVVYNGDLLCSSPIPGFASRQNDDIVHSYTVAKATGDIIRIEGLDGCPVWKSKKITYNQVTYTAVLLPCIYLL